MKQRMRYVFVLALAAGGIVVSACSDDDSSSGSNGGSGGASGTKTGGSSSGGSGNKAGNGGKAGSDSGGKAGSATAGSGGAPATAGAGGAADGGIGGATAAGAGGSDAGAGGMGGAGEPALVYACGSADLFQKTCSAWVAADCTNETVCADCVQERADERAAFQTDPPCDACNAQLDAFYQCQVDAFESGNLSAGVVCFQGFADGSDSCYPFLDNAVACEGYLAVPNDCPASWPPPSEGGAGGAAP